VVADADGADRQHWPELDQAANRLACGLLGLGLKHGDRIALLMPNRLEGLTLLVSAARIGLVVSALPPGCADGWLHERLADGPVKAAFAVAHHGAAEPLGQLARLQPRLPALRHAIAVEGVGLCSLASLAATPIDAPRLGAARRAVQAGDGIWLDHSGGAGGRSTARLLDHAQAIAQAMRLAAQLQLGQSDLLHLATPMHHTEALLSMLALMASGGSLLLNSGLRPERLSPLMTRLPATVLAAPPQTLADLLAATSTAQADLRRVRLVVGHGSGLAASLRSQLGRRLPGARWVDWSQTDLAQAA
jgi:acyl-coenzyme A synthetase/AMP-(fatty) acid ligase